MMKYYVIHVFECGPSPPTPTSRPPDIIHVIGVLRPSPFFMLFHFRVLYSTQTEEQKTGEAWDEAMQISIHTTSAQPHI